MLRYLYAEFKKSQFALFTKEIVTGCEKGDPLCLLLFEDAGKYLAKHAEAVAKKSHNVSKSNENCIQMIKTHRFL